MLDKKKFENLGGITTRELQTLLALPDSKLFNNSNNAQGSSKNPDRKYKHIAALRCVTKDGRVSEIYVCKYNGKPIFKAFACSDNSWVAYNENPRAPMHFRAPFSDLLEKLETLLAKKTVLYSGGDATYLGELTFKKSTKFRQIEGFIAKKNGYDFPDIYENFLYTRFNVAYTRDLDPPSLILLYRAVKNRFPINEQSEEEQSQDNSANSSPNLEKEDENSESESESELEPDTIDLSGEVQNFEPLSELSDIGMDDTYVQDWSDWGEDNQDPVPDTAQKYKELIIHPLSKLNPQQSGHLFREFILKVLKAIFCIIYMVSDYIAISYVKKL